MFIGDKKDKFFAQFFASKPTDKMSDIAENFVPEYANVLTSLVGANFIH